MPFVVVDNTYIAMILSLHYSFTEPLFGNENRNILLHYSKTFLSIDICKHLVITLPA